MKNSRAVCLYIHIPYCISKCEYCDFFSIVCDKTAGRKIPDTYIQALCREIKFRMNEYKADNLKSVYIGGGTPSLLEPDQLQKICECFAPYNHDFEFTMEVNPDDVTVRLLEAMEQCGINRISCGIQSCTDECLCGVNRRAKKNENLAAMELIHRHWHKKKSYDLICGLPGETKESFIQTLDTVIKYQPHHISMYSLTIEDETPLGQKLNSGKLEYDFNSSDELWLSSKKYLEDNGYRQYEVSNFCTDGNECIHNLAYWNHQDYLGCGSGATGTVYREDGTGHRWTNTKDINKYVSFWLGDAPTPKLNSIQTVEEIDFEDSVFEYFMMGLRKRTGITDRHFYQTFRRAIPAEIITRFEQWQKKGLAEIENNGEVTRYSLNEQGLLFLNRFLEEI
ncbi:MAG: radical SAM family heme chaperone HemW [Treponema sp.]|nr:radical SAM family heme chaperone HemW [Treponema sp.]